MTVHASLDPSTALMERLATRIKDARIAKKMPRRALSEKSGVSPRYLAQLESGQGNISIVLLQRVAEALEVPMAILLAETTPWDRDMARVMTLYRDANEDVQSQVRTILAGQNPGALRAGRIGLIGLRGAGKTSLGKMAGEALGLPFVELNKEIEAHTAMPLAEVMALYGPDGYRALEAEALARVTARYDRMILAVAGGIVADQGTYAQLKERFHTVWIQASPAEHMQRVRAQGDLRPMEGNPAAMAQLKSILDERAPLYAQAEARLDTTDKPLRGSLNSLLTLIASNAYLTL